MSSELSLPIHIIIVGEFVAEIVLLNNIFRHICHFEADVFISRQWSVEVENLMSNEIYSAFVVDRTQLKISLMVSKSAVGVPKSPG